MFNNVCVYVRARVCVCVCVHRLIKSGKKIQEEIISPIW